MLFVRCSYTIPTFIQGYKKDLEISDLYETLTEHKSNRLGDQLEAAWNHELEKAAKQGRQASLRRALVKVFGLEFMLYGLVLLASEVFVR